MAKKIYVRLMDLVKQMLGTNRPYLTRLKIVDTDYTLGDLFKYLTENLCTSCG